MQVATPGLPSPIDQLTHLSRHPLQAILALQHRQIQVARPEHALPLAGTGQVK